jgi:phosphate uptake regulator
LTAREAEFIMRIPGGLDENFRFLVLEVRKQVEETLNFLAEPSQMLLERINNRDDYIDTMKSLVEEHSYAFLTGSGLDRRGANCMRAVNIIASNLERIGDFSVNVVNQVQYLSDPRILARYDFQPFFDETFTTLENVTEALTGQNIALAFAICQAEFHMDSLYKEAFDNIVRELGTGAHTGDLVTSLFIFRYLERMGDSLLNIGEALIFAIVGERLKIHQYQALRDHLASSGIGFPVTNSVEFQSIWGTRSGCRIGTVKEKGAEAKPQRVIFKEGRLSKIVAEKRSIERWQELMPELPPRIFGFQQKKNSGSLLLEYLGGCTFQDVLLNSERELLLDNPLFLVTETLGSVWRATMKHEPAPARFIPQLLARMDDVYRLYPHFGRARAHIGGLGLDPMGDLLRRADEADMLLAAPFSVLIHGDFNLDNVIYHHTEQRVHFIDLHRSINSDYVQDVSVFLVSIIRLSVQRSFLRRRINGMVLDFLRFAQGFAQKNGDETFAARLTLGLIRSFFTSTRFELNADFAKTMYLRSIYLMERISAHNGRPWREFVLPEDVLIY